MTLTIDEALRAMHARLDAEEGRPAPARPLPDVVLVSDPDRLPPPCSSSGCQERAVKDWLCARHPLLRPPAVSPSTGDVVAHAALKVTRSALAEIREQLARADAAELDVTALRAIATAALEATGGAA